MTYFISTPLLELTRLAGVAPERIDALIDRRLARRQVGLMGPGEHYPSTLTRRTGVRVVSLARRSRHLLLNVENRPPFWCYREYGRNACLLSIPSELPTTTLAACIGRRLDSLVETETPIDQVEIVGFDDGQPGTTVLTLAPQWIRHRV